MMQPEQQSLLILPKLGSKRGWKNAERVSEDTKPSVALTNLGSTASSDVAHEIVCAVCSKNQARYACPRCQIQYCCVECYRKHTSGKDGESQACTEDFYKNRVASILELEARERKVETANLLNAHYKSYREDEQSPEDVLSDQLHDLLQILDEQQDENLLPEQVLALLPPALRSDFQRDLQNGKLQDMLLKRWFPWWKRQLGVDGDDQGSFRSGKTLDEKLMNVPKFGTISRSRQISHSLLFNLFDVIYAFCWTMRLYHGLPNILAGGRSKPEPESDIDGGLVMDAAATMIGASAVLSNDARFNSLEHVLATCTTSSTRAYPDSCNAEWAVLVEDCAEIISSHRLVGRALLEVKDLFKAATARMKAEESKPSSTTRNDREAQLPIRQFRKKVDFFLSWALDSKHQFDNNLREEVLRWSRRWGENGVTGDDYLQNESIRNLRIPEPSRQTLNKVKRETDEEPPLMIELSSTSQA